MRNPTLANLFFLAGEIEKFGTGIKKIINACKAHNIPTPEFDNSSNAFCVVFRKSILYNIINKHNLNSRQMKCISYLIEKKEITTSNYSQMFNIAVRTARLDIKELVKIGIIEEMGETNKRFYRLRRI